LCKTTLFHPTPVGRGRGVGDSSNVLVSACPRVRTAHPHENVPVGNYPFVSEMTPCRRPMPRCRHPHPKQLRDRAPNSTHAALLPGEKRKGASGSPSEVERVPKQGSTHYLDIPSEARLLCRRLEEASPWISKMRDPRGGSTQPGCAVLPPREGDYRAWCPRASGYQSSFSEESHLHV